MSKGIREGVKVTLTDGKEREIYPLSLRNLRRVMKIMKGVDGNMDELNDDTIGVLIDAARIILEKVDPKVVSESKAVHAERAGLIKEGKTEEAEELEDPLEDLLDITSVNKIIAVGMGADPNL